MRYRYFPIRIFSPSTHPEMITIYLQNELFNWKKSDLRMTKRKGERKTVLCKCKAFFIHNNKVNETTLPNVYEPLAEPVWNFISAFRLGLAESCFLKACPCGGFSKSKWGFKPIQLVWKLPACFYIRGEVKCLRGTGFLCYMTIFQLFQAWLGRQITKLKNLHRRDLSISSLLSQQVQLLLISPESCT